jgi:hypothetical protein
LSFGAAVWAKVVIGRAAARQAIAAAIDAVLRARLCRCIYDISDWGLIGELRSCALKRYGRLLDMSRFTWTYSVERIRLKADD